MIKIDTSAMNRACAVALFFVCLDITSVLGQLQVLQCETCMLEDVDSRAIVVGGATSVLGLDPREDFFPRVCDNKYHELEGLVWPIERMDYRCFNFASGSISEHQYLVLRDVALYALFESTYGNYSSQFRFDPWYKEFNISGYDGLHSIMQGVQVGSSYAVDKVGCLFIDFILMVHIYCILLGPYGLACDRKFYFATSYVLLLEKLYGIELVRELETGKSYFCFMGEPRYVGDPEQEAKRMLMKLAVFEQQGVSEGVQQLVFDTTMLVVGLYNHYIIAKGKGYGDWLAVIAFARSQLKGQFVQNLSITDLFANATIGPTLLYIVEQVQQIVKKGGGDVSDPVKDTKASPHSIILHFTRREHEDNDWPTVFKNHMGLLNFRKVFVSEDYDNEFEMRQFLRTICDSVEIWRSPMQRRINRDRGDLAGQVPVVTMKYWALCNTFPLFSFKELEQFYSLVSDYENSGLLPEIAHQEAFNAIQNEYIRMYGDRVENVPQASFSIPPTIKALISLCAVAITVLGLKEVSLDKAISTVNTAMRYHTLVRGTDLVSDIVNGLEVVFMTLKTIYSTKSFDCLVDCTREMIELDKDVKTVLAEIENMDVLNLDFPTPWLQVRLDRLVAAQDKYTHWKAMFPHKRVDLDANIATCKLVSSVAENRIRALSSSRAKPFCFVLSGPSSVGKTSLVSMIMAQYCCDAPRCIRSSVRNGGTGLDPNGYVYATLGNTTDEYDNEISNSQWGLIFDDVAVVGPKVNTGAHIASLIQKLIKILNVSPASSMQAGLDKKGKIFYNHSIVGITTNQPEMFVPQIAATPSAIFRRVDVFVDMQVKPEFCKEGTTQLDPSKLDQASRYNGRRGQLVDCWNFQMYYYVVNGNQTSRREILQTGSSVAFLKKLSDMWFEDADNSTRSQKSCGTGTFKPCSRCHMVGADSDGLCHASTCRAVVGGGYMSLFTIVMKVLLVIDVSYVAHWLFLSSNLAFICIEEYIKRAAFGYIFPIVEYIAYVAVFRSTFIAKLRLLPLLLHYCVMNIDLWNAIAIHYAYNVLVYFIEMRDKRLFLASITDIPVCKSWCDIFQMVKAVVIVLYIGKNTSLFYDFVDAVSNSGWLLERLVFIYCIYSVAGPWMHAMAAGAMRSEIVHNIRWPLLDEFLAWFNGVYSWIFTKNRKYVMFFSAVVLALAILKGANVLSNMQQFRPQGLGDEPLKGRNVWASVPIHTPIHSPGTHPKPFATKLAMNTVEFVFKHEGDDKVIKALAIAGSSFLVTKHEAMVLYGKDCVRTTIRQPSIIAPDDYEDEFEVVRHRPARTECQIVLDHSNFLFHPSKDLCVVTLNVVPYPSLVKYFPRELQPNINRARTVGVKDGHHQVIGYPRLSLVRDVPVQGQPNQTAYIGHGFSSEDNKIHSAVGFCGNVLYNAVSGCNAIYGIHNSGNPVDGSCAFVPVLYSDLEFFLRNIPIVDVQEVLSEVYPSDAGALVHQQKHQTYHTKNAFGFCDNIVGSPCRIWMTLGNVCQIDLKSKFCESRFVRWWSAAKIRLGDGVYRPLLMQVMRAPELPPRWRWLPKYRFADVITQPKEYLSFTQVRGLANLYLERLLLDGNFMDRLRGIRPLDLTETVNGVPGARYIKRVNMDSSAGYPYNTPKKNLCEFRDGVYTLPRHICDRLEIMKSRLKQHKAAGIIFTASVKDEPVSDKKLHSFVQDKKPGEVSKPELDVAISQGFGKIRIFQAISIEGCLLIRQFFLMLVSLLQEFRFLSCIAVGLNCFSEEWDELYRHMTPEWDEPGCHKFICGDFSNYDQKIASEFLRQAWWVLRELWLHSDYVYSLDPESRNAFIAMLDTLIVEMSNPLTWFWGDLVHLHGSNASGHPLTVIINGIVNYMYMAYAFGQIYPEHQFDKMVVMMTYGDDNILTVHPDCPKYNQIEITRVLANIGVIYTSSDKKLVSVEYEDSLTFLKRSWVLHNYEVDGEVYQYYACPLDWSSFSKTLSVEKKIGADSDVRMISVLASISLEMMQYGSATYNSFMDVAESFLEEYKLRGTYAQCMRSGWTSMETYLRNRKNRSDSIPSLSPMFSDSEAD